MTDYTCCIPYKQEEVVSCYFIGWHLSRSSMPAIVSITFDGLYGYLLQTAIKYWLIMLPKHTWSKTTRSAYLFSRKFLSGRIIFVNRRKHLINSSVYINELNWEVLYFRNIRRKDLMIGTFDKDTIRHNIQANKE